MSSCDEAELARLQALADAATRGPWKSDLDVFGPDEPEIIACVTDEPIDLLAQIATGIVPSHEDDSWPRAHASQAKRDAQFIAASREAVPALIAEVRRLRGELLRAAAAESTEEYGSGWRMIPEPVCSRCGGKRKIQPMPPLPEVECWKCS